MDVKQKLYFSHFHWAYCVNQPNNCGFSANQIVQSFGWIWSVTNFYLCGKCCSFNCNMFSIDNKKHKMIISCHYLVADRELRNCRNLPISNPRPDRHNITHVWWKSTDIYSLLSNENTDKGMTDTQTHGWPTWNHATIVWRGIKKQMSWEKGSLDFPMNQIFHARYLSKSTYNSMANVLLWPTAYISEQHRFWLECVRSTEPLLLAYAIMILFLYCISAINPCPAE